MEKKDQIKGKEQNTKTSDFDQLSAQADKERKEKKPGSQSNHSKQHNNGRGGGK